MSSEEVIFTTPPLTKIWGNIFPLPIDSIILNSYDGGIVFNKINLKIVEFLENAIPHGYCQVDNPDLMISNLLFEIEF